MQHTDFQTIVTRVERLSAECRARVNNANTASLRGFVDLLADDEFVTKLAELRTHDDEMQRQVERWRLDILRIRELARNFPRDVFTDPASIVAPLEERVVALQQYREQLFRREATPPNVDMFFAPQP